MKYFNVEQGTQEWLALRAGKVTASRVKDVLATIKSGEAVARRDYRTQIVTEILTGAPVSDGFTNDAMRWGTEQEPMARSAYEVFTGKMVEVVGFVLHPTVARSGCSPDGLLGWDGNDTLEGIVQFKCPKTSTHLDYILDGRVPTNYHPQMLWEMACTGAPWCDFVSYDPRVPEHLQLFIRRFPRDQKRIDEITKEVLEFLGDVDAMLERLAGAAPVEA